MTYDKDSITFAPLSTDPKFQNLTGQMFGRLTVIGFAGNLRDWWCECECGAIKKVFSGSLKRGKTKSCGCYNQDISRQRQTTHGEAHKTPEYKAYWSAKGRCDYPSANGYENYGKRGIKFLFTSYEEFRGAVGTRPTDKHSLDRIDVNGHYEVGNVRWATSKEQNRNRRDNKMLEYNGETKCLVEWCETLNMKYGSIVNRLRAGWSINRAFETPSL